MKKTRLFSNQILLAQAAAILIWLMISVIQWSNNPKSSPGLLIPIIVRGIESFSILLISFILLFTIDKLTLRIKQYLVLMLMIPLIYLASITANILSLEIRNLIGFAPPPIDSFFFIQSLHFYIPLTLVLVFVEIIRYKNLAQIENENKLIAEKSLHESQWLMLRYQLNPHFLFNALNTIRALIGVDDEKARKTVTEMSEYFRYSLSIKDKYNVTIAEEINAVNNYLEIQKIRFQEKINVILKLEKDISDYLIPVFTIQTLVENAVKYGLKTSENNLQIEIEILSKELRLLIFIKNSGRFIEQTENEVKGNGTNTGIANLKSRLKYFDKNAKFQLFEKDGFVIAQIELIKHRASDEKLENPDC